MQKLAIFRKVKPPARRAYAPEGKSRNYTSRLQAGTSDSADWRRNCGKGQFLDGNYL